MLKIGRYGIALQVLRNQVAKVPTRVWNYGWFWFTKEVNPNDVNLEQLDEKRRFLAGAEVERGGKRYYYLKMVPKCEQLGDTPVGERFKE